MNQRDKRKTIFWSLIIFCALVVLGAAVFFVYNWAQQIKVTDVVRNEAVQNQIKKRVSKENRFFLSLVPTFLGFDEPKTFLVMFLNNTELRPGGGFIGSYATLRVSEGRIKVLQLRGVEKLDSQTPKSWKPEPPELIKDKLKVDRWYFRDSNWSPDFKKNAQRGLKFYSKEGGTAAEEIDFVAAITTQVLKEVVRIVGPIEVEGLKFNADNVVEKLQYEVSYGFKDRGLSFRDRKQIMKPFFQKLTKKIQANLFKEYKNYLKLARRMLEEKHVVVFAQDNKLQKKLAQKGFTGQLKQTSGDFLMWVDANLAALKTDHAIDRSLNYKIDRKGDQFVATASMTYKHTGEYDWRTSKYITFARVYTPKGSKLLSAQEDGEDIDRGKIRRGREIQKQWFGHLTTLEPGQAKTLSFDYTLPKRVANKIKNGSYKLIAQKQIGTIKPKLTLELEFGKNITNASPSELKKYWGNDKYTISTNLRTDRQFKVKF
ncbi:MAG: DUF4012 domain-containing protein [Candidatus Paceibacteria bacterium]